MKKTTDWKLARLLGRRGRRRINRLNRRRGLVSKQISNFEILANIAPAEPHRNPKLSSRRSVRVIKPPTTLDLEGGYKETIGFLKNVRFATSQLRGNILVDLKVLEDISPSAALLLVAECDRWRERTKAQWLSASDLNSWNPSVRRRLKEMGFFEVLKTRDVPSDSYVNGEDRYVPFLTGRRNPGPSAAELRERIERLGPSIADRESLYDGLVEAMTNVSQHAYVARRGSGDQERWWISASVNAEKNIMKVMVVDHGVGIARTLPRSSTWESVRKYIPLDAVKDDAELVRAAFAKGGVNRSQTGEEYRGKGLRENIKGYVESHDSRGRLRVITNRAMYTYSRSGGVEDESSVSVPISFDGTFIEWMIEDYGRNGNEIN